MSEDIQSVEIAFPSAYTRYTFARQTVASSLMTQAGAFYQNIGESILRLSGPEEFLKIIQERALKIPECKILHTEE